MFTRRILTTIQYIILLCELSWMCFSITPPSIFRQGAALASSLLKMYLTTASWTVVSHWVLVIKVSKSSLIPAPSSSKQASLTIVTGQLSSNDQDVCCEREFLWMKVSSKKLEERWAPRGSLSNFVRELVQNCAMIVDVSFSAPQKSRVVIRGWTILHEIAD